MPLGQHTPTAACIAVVVASFLAAPAAGREAPGVETPPASTPAGTGRQVYVCEDAGIPAYSDRPCGRAAVPRTVSFAAPPTGAAATTSPPSPRAATRPRPQPVAEQAPGEVASDRCAALRRQLEALDDRMRTGYSSREAARLWNRWRDLRSRLRSERC